LRTTRRPIDELRNTRMTYGPVRVGPSIQEKRFRVPVVS